MYEALVRMAPTIGGVVGRAAAVAESRGAEPALALLDEIPIQSVETYQPYWALSAHLLKRMQRFDEARAAYTRAIRLCEDSAMREYLKRKAAEIA
jgi:RNA polymerase sigma-70 factor (ECF subfamily)